MVFERAADAGQLRCWIGEGYLGKTEVKFALDGKPIDQQSIVGIQRISEIRDRLSDGLRGPMRDRMRDIYHALEERNATGIWNLQVVLYGDEPDQIEAALEEAKKDVLAREETTIEESDIRVIETGPKGIPVAVDSERFSWRKFPNEGYLKEKATGRTIYQMAYLRPTLGSDDIEDEEVIAAVRTFWHELDLITKHAEMDAERKERIAERNAERPALGWEETKRRERQWDLLHNEGGEGFNPYRA